MCVEGDLRQRQLAGRQFRHRPLQPYAADVAVGRNTHGKCELAREVEPAVTRDARESCERDVAIDVSRDIGEYAVEPDIIESMQQDAPVSSVGSRSGFRRALKKRDRARDVCFGGVAIAASSSECGFYQLPRDS